jgi:uncharacterized protein YaiE (UPF0345 family)
METITHHSYALDSRVQLLGFTDTSSGIRMLSGVALPGEFDFGKAEGTKTIEVIHGELIGSDGAVYTKGQTLTFKPGERIFFSCKHTVAYLCRYM